MFAWRQIIELCRKRQFVYIIEITNQEILHLPDTSTYDIKQIQNLKKKKLKTVFFLSIKKKLNSIGRRDCLFNPGKRIRLLSNVYS